MRKGTQESGEQGADGKNRDARAQSHWSWHSALGTKDREEGRRKKKARVFARDRRGRGIGRKTPNKLKKKKKKKKKG